MKKIKILEYLNLLKSGNMAHETEKWQKESKHEAKNNKLMDRTSVYSSHPRIDVADM